MEEKNILTFKEVLEQEYQEVIVVADGYNEGRVFPVWQPFKRDRKIVFKVNRFGYSEGYLEHKTFTILDNEDKLEYELKDDGKVYLYYPEIMADVEY